MPPQRSDVEYDGQPRQTRRARFLQLGPGGAVGPVGTGIRPVYPRGERGRPPYPLAVMLRIHCVQLCYNLSDSEMEDSLYGSVRSSSWGCRAGATAR